jgi:electron transfer flavoprotein alpha/beta subunit
MTAALLGWSQVAFAANINIEGDQIQADRETDTGTETISTK